MPISLQWASLLVRKRVLWSRYLAVSAPELAFREVGFHYWTLHYLHEASMSDDTDAPREQAAFVVWDKKTNRTFAVYANGRIEGFGDDLSDICVINRIPILIAQAEARAAQK